MFSLSGFKLGRSSNVWNRHQDEQDELVIPVKRSKSTNKAPAQPRKPDANTINLSERPETSFPVDLIKDKVKNACVEIMFAYGKKFTSIPEQIGGLDKLVHLNISDNELTTLPAAIKHLTSLRDLIANNNKIKSLPPEIGELSSLVNFNISNNTLEKIPAAVGKLYKLETFYANHNQLKEVPDEMFAMPPEQVGPRKLRRIELHDNQIERLPAELGNAVHMELLDLSNNNLRELPDSVGYLKELWNFQVQGNKNLKTLPWALGSCVKLKYIKRDGTQLTEDHVDRVLDRCAFNRVHGTLDLGARLDLWTASAKNPHDLSFLLNNEHFSNEERWRIDEWLYRLEGTQDFKRCKEHIVTVVCDLLATLRPPLSHQAQEFRQLFFLDLQVHFDGHCANRPAMVLNLVYTNWQVAMLSHEDLTLNSENERKKLKILVGTAKVTTLREAIMWRLKGRNGTDQTTEWYLRAETVMQERLGVNGLDLSTAVRYMDSEVLGDRFSVEEEQAIFDEVNERYLDVFLTFSAAEAMLKSHSEYVRRRAEIEVQQTSLESEYLEKEWESEGAQLVAAAALKEGKEKALASLRTEFAKKIIAELE